MEAFAVSSARSDLRDAVDALVDECIDGLSTDALGEDLIDIRRAADRLDAEFLRRLDRFDRGHGGCVDGGGSTPSWLREHCAMTWKAGAYRGRLARTFSELPATLDSARAGRAPLGNVTMIAQLAGAVGVDHVAPLERILVGAAETLDLARMRTLTQATRLRLDPDGVLAEDNHAHERRWFNLDQSFGGAWFAQGRFDAGSGALLNTLLEATIPTPGAGDMRHASERRADALIELAGRKLRSGTHPDVHGQRPHLTVTVSADTLRSDGAGGPAAELRGVGPIHPETARRIACDASRTVVKVAPPAEGWAAIAMTTPVVPLSVGRATRIIPVSIRTALALRDDGCRFPGCDRPIEWTDGHHIIHWADGGLTELDNLVSLCRRHHRAVHEEGWRVHIADGIPVVEPPP